MRYLRYTFEHLFEGWGTFIKDWAPQALFTILFAVTSMGLLILGANWLQDVIGLEAPFVAILFIVGSALVILTWSAVCGAMNKARDRIKKENEELINSIKDPK